MAEPTPIDAAIEQAALKPSRVQVGNMSTEQRSVDDLVKAATFVAGRQVTNPFACIGRAKIVPPGAG